MQSFIFYVIYFTRRKSGECSVADFDDGRISNFEVVGLIRCKVLNELRVLYLCFRNLIFFLLFFFVQVSRTSVVCFFLFFSRNCRV